MSKFNWNPLRLGLASVLVIGASVVTAASASAAPKEPVFSFCHKPAGAAVWPFTSNKCSPTEQSAGTNTGEWALAYAFNATHLLTCKKSEAGEYTTLLCNLLSPTLGGGSFDLVLKEEPTPIILGVPLDAATLKGELAGAKTQIGCRTGKFSAQPEVSGKLSKGILEYTNCTVGAPANCSVKVPIEAEFTGQLEGSDKVKFTGTKEKGATNKEIFTEITYEGCEALRGDTFAVKGSQKCEGASGILTLKTLQTLFCRASESSLTLGPNKATYENEVSLDASSGENWAILLLTP
jgi:hypothetical protein